MMGSEYKPCLLFTVVCLTFPIFFMFGITNLCNFGSDEQTLTLDDESNVTSSQTSGVPYLPNKRASKVGSSNDGEHLANIHYVDELDPLIAEIDTSPTEIDNGLTPSKPGKVKRSVEMSEEFSYDDYEKDFDPSNLPYELSEEDYLHYATLPKDPLPRSAKRAPGRRKDLTKFPSLTMHENIPHYKNTEFLPPPSDAFLVPSGIREEEKRTNNNNRVVVLQNGKKLQQQGSSAVKKKTEDADKEEEKKLNAMLNPKPPLDLPIVKPEVQKLENEPAAKLIPTKGKPFHFHIPIVSKEPQEKLSLAEMTELAKKYKNPLTLNPIVYKAAAAGQILTEKQIKSMKRMVRDSAMLNFLNMATFSGSEKTEIGKDLTDLMGSKRSILHMNATDEILQELVGDADDLKNLNVAPPEGMTLAEGGGSEKKTRSDDDTTRKEQVIGVKPKSRKRQPVSFPSGRVEIGNSPRRKRVLDQDDFFKDFSILPSEEEIVSSEESHLSERDIIMAPEEESILTPQEIEMHHRSKRGLGRWIKNVFGFGKTTTPPTTTTTTTTPKPSSSSSSSSSSEEDSDESSEEKAKKKKHKKKSKKHKKKKHHSKSDKHESITVSYDSNGDSEVDFLLPVALRRSTYLKKHSRDKYQDQEEEEEDEDYRKKRDKIQEEPTKKLLGK